MSTRSNEFQAFVLEQLTRIDDLSCSRFFGGFSLKSSSVLFAMIMDNALYFAVDEDSRVEYEKLGSRCFSFDSKKGRVDVKRFFEVPAEIMDDQERLVAFANAAIAAALKSASSGKSRGKKTKN